MAVLTTIPALTVWQPWASLLANGSKLVETRNWRPRFSRYPLPVAIHAARSFPRQSKEFLEDAAFARCLHQARPADLPLGAVVAIGLLTMCVPTIPYRDTLSAQERTFGNYGPGRFAWIFEKIQALPEPIPVRGSLNLWAWTPADPTILEPWA